MSSPVKVFMDLPRGRDVLRVSASTFKNREYIDIRVWYTDRDGDLKPTAKGVSIRPDAVLDVVQALQAAYEATGGTDAR
jgi:hypothetical protein